MSFRQIYGFLCVLLVIFSGCRKENAPVPVNYKFNYFPLKHGLQRIYKVTDITIDDTINKYDTVIYELKERIDSFFTDNSGNTAWRLERYKRADSSQAWQISDVWENQILNNQAHSVEENQRFVKIIFPPENEKSWDGNAFNTLDAKTYIITGIDQPVTLNGLFFDSVLTVNQENSESYINKYLTIEQYAVNYGLINKMVIAIDQAYVILNEPIEQHIKIGHLYYQTIISVNSKSAK
ncbi:MAG: hypothetical protein COX07_03505 [Bacteroidetes bacterium CG23_combo_of_CG06-09_8_20_14_all_32_9]|nr:MAG: hypothetical protein COX07_03505 [Bacteroidetes bacterium CG23_combo_of_CG06-09_8_20_14_all_32_9]